MPDATGEPSPRARWDDVEALGREVTVERKGLPEAMAAHERERDVVDQADLAPVRGDEGGESVVVQLSVDPAEPHERQHVGGQGGDRGEPQPPLGEGHGLEDDVAVGRERLTVIEEPPELLPGPGVDLVGPVEQRVERRCVEEGRYEP